MAKFLTGDDLNSEIGKIIKNAKDKLILISPYIKLHDRIKSTLSEKKNLAELEIIIVFGKNENDAAKSMSLEDMTFFSQFSNVQIKHEKRLHAKYYANESAAILTSMNLYSYSQDNNIETGVLTKTSSIGNIASSIFAAATDSEMDSLDKQAQKYFEIVINQSKPVFSKTPQYETKLFGLSQKEIAPLIIDNIAEYFQTKPKSESYSAPVVKKDTENSKQSGYCIRTGDKIPFNPAKPLSETAFKSWSKYGDPAYKEKYCHFSGEQSSGATSVEKPILSKNWRKAKEMHGF